MRFSRIVAILGLATFLACASAKPKTDARELPLAARVQAPGLLFELLYTQPDNEVVGRIGSGLLSAGPRLSRWGSFKAGVKIRVYPNHEALEAEVDRHDYPWLRAWAFRDEILLQSPRSWNAESTAALDEELQELLVHELTHSLMYQLMEQEGPFWAADEPPLWFREGMASVTAGQGHRRLSSEALREWVQAHPGVDPLHPPPEVYRVEKEAVYGAAHRAFDLLVRLSGDQAIKDVLRGVRAGARFVDAFKTATGHALPDFEKAALRAGFDETALNFQPAPALGAGGP